MRYALYYPESQSLTYLRVHHSEPGKEDIRNIWRGSTQGAKVGEEGNETGTHSASETDHVE